MIDGLLKRFGVSPEMARSAAGAVASEFRDVAGDALGATIALQVRRTMRPVLLQMRGELLASIAGEPPAGFATRLRTRGYEINDEQVATLWADVIASIAEQPAQTEASPAA